MPALEEIPQSANRNRTAKSLSPCALAGAPECQ
jgi:hypothetical protein